MKHETDRIFQIEILFRVAGFLLFLIFFISRLSVVNKYGNSNLLSTQPLMFFAYRALWLLESIIYIFFMAAYIFRKPARSLGNGFMETVFPFITAGLPFLMLRYDFFELLSPGSTGLYQDFTRLSWGGREMIVTQVGISPVPLAAVIAVMLAGTVLSVMSLCFLWKSFSIMVEARELVVTGIYKYIRHPLYLGEMTAYLGVLMLRFSYENLLIYVTFAFCQYLRAQIEEDKLKEVFPQYAKYIETTDMFFPGSFFKSRPKWNNFF